MSIPGALPDLTSVVVTVDPVNPGNHQVALVNATVYNSGDVAAHNVTAYFYDEAENIKDFIGIGTIDSIPVDGSGVISVEWTAHSPLAPFKHNISALIDPLNTVPGLNEATVTGYIEIEVKRKRSGRCEPDG